jgi:GAF domain-containing protein
MSRELRVREAIDRFVIRVRQDTDRRLEELAAELLQTARGDMRTSRVDLERAAVDVARAVAKGGVQARHELMGRVVHAIRTLDDAVSLRGVLDALAEGAAFEASRVAVLLLDGETLRSYRHSGFGPGLSPVDMDLAAVPLLSKSVALRQAATVPAVGDRPDAGIPAFMRVASGQVGLVLPVVLGEQVVAVLYAEGADRQATESGEPVWTEQVEVLVRHAAAKLENVTSKRTVEVLSNPS